MTFTPPYVLDEALQAPNQGLVTPHTEGYRRLLEAVRDDRFDFDAINGQDVMTFNALPIKAVNDQDVMTIDTLPIEEGA